MAIQKWKGERERLEYKISRRKTCSERPEFGLEAAASLVTAFNIHIQNLNVT